MMDSRELAVMIEQVVVPQEAVAAFCRKWRIAELALFGSVLREDFRPDSDVDVMIAFEPGAHWDFTHLSELKAELERIFGRKVDLVERRLIEGSENYLRRKHILSHLKRIYVAR